MVATIGRKLFSQALVLGFLTLHGAGAQAEASEAAIAQCERAIVNGARGGAVPEPVLHSISLNETGRMQNGRLRPWPWAINREGKGHWFANREEALEFARKSVADGRHSFDVGCFQINYHWHGHNFHSLESMFDPEVGAAYAAKFLGDLYQEKGDWSQAAGAYHSRTPSFANKYRARFDRILSNLGGAPLVVAAASAQPDDAAQKRKPRTSRERLKRKPLIIRLDAAAPAAAPVPKAVRRDEVVTPSVQASAADVILAHGEPIVFEW